MPSPTFTNAFNNAVDHVMLYEVGGFWKLTPEVAAGLCDTRQRAQAVGYTNDPTDAGGETKFGVAKNANPDLNIRALTWDQAKAVYYTRYWTAAKCDQLAPRIAVLSFDVAVNNGVGRAAIFLQRAIGVSPDGDVGPATLAKANASDAVAVCNKICDLREQFYRDIVSSKPIQAKYLNGWLRRCNELRVFSTNPTSTFE